MKLFNIKTSIIVFITVLMFSSCAESDDRSSRVEMLPYFNDPSFTPIWVDNRSDLPKGFHQIPAFDLTNQEGKRVDNQTFEGKIYVTDFFFTTCPGICPKMTANMGRLQDVFLDDDEVLLLSHSVTPERDSVSVLKAYAENKEVINDKWHLVTGEQKEIYALGRESYFVEEDLGLEKSEFDFLHTENFVLIDKERHIRGIYNGLNKTSVAQLITDIKTLKKEG